MGGKQAKQLKSFQDELKNQTGPIKDLAFLTYDVFLKRIEELNNISETIIDDDKYKLEFVIKKDTDSTIFWKKTVQISCFKLDKYTGEIETSRILSLVQVLRIYRLMMYQLGPEWVGVSQSEEEASEGTSNSAQGQSSDANRTIPKYVEAGEDQPPICQKLHPRRIENLTTSMILNTFSDGNEPSLLECCICMERKPEVILPCTHNYCLPCIERWNVCHKTCPICRETLKTTDDTWVLSEAPDSAEMASELSRTLMKLTD